MTPTFGYSVLRILATQCLLAIILDTTAMADIVVYHSDHRKTSEYDPGSMRVFLRNTGDETVRIEHVLLDDIPIPVWGITTNLRAAPLVPAVRQGDNGQPIATNTPGTDELSLRRYAHKRLIWARLRPPSPSPGEFCELIVKLADPLAGPSTLSLLTAEGSRVDAEVRPGAHTLVITAITFSDKLKKAYVYVQNRSDSTLTIDTVELDGTDISNRLRLPTRTLKPGEKQACTIRPARRLVDGSYHVFKVTAREGHVTSERVRARHLFPITCEMAHPADHTDFGMDPPPFIFFDRDVAPVDKNVHSKRFGPRAAGVHVFGCVMHSFQGDQARAAQEFFHRSDQCELAVTRASTIVTPCKIRPEEGYAKFGETGDIVQFNPLVLTSASRGRHGERPLEIAARIARYAVAAAAPRPTYAMLPTNKLGTQHLFTETFELRRLAYTTLGRGAKGLIYRHLGWYDPNGQAINGEIRRLNEEIRTLRPWLAVADTIAAVTTTRSDVTSYSLLTPDDRIILVLVGPWKPPVKDESVTVHVDLPDWLVAKRLFKVGAGRFERGQRLRPTPRLSLDLPVPASATAYVIKCSSR